MSAIVDSLAISNRARTILGRFPCHLGVDDPAKVLAHVVDDLARELDVAASSLGRIRRSHRVGDVDNEWDLFALADLHGLDPADFDLLARRWAPIRTAGQTLRDDPTTAADVRAQLPSLLNLTDDVFAMRDGETDAGTADRRLAEAMISATAYPAEVAELRARLVRLVADHRRGNGTNASLLAAAAAHLGLDEGPVSHHEDRFWHVMPCIDRTRLIETHPVAARPGEASTSSIGTPLDPAVDLLAIEENPFQLADLRSTERVNGQRFATTRAGWEPVPVTTIVTGIGERTHAPMVVNVDTGAGTAFTGTVPDGVELRFEATGRVLLDDAEVTRRCYSFQGAVFADVDAHSRDFVFADGDADAAEVLVPNESTTVGLPSRTGTFAVTAPIEQAFDMDVVFPHSGGLLDAPHMLVGTTRWGFFVGEGHFGRIVDDGDEPAIPEFAAGRWDDSVFDTLEVDATRMASGAVGFEWQEREAFAVRLWLPLRFADLDTDGVVTVRERVRQLLNRFRPAGVHLYVEYADDRWTLSTGVTRILESLSPIGTVVAGTVLYPDPEPEPDPAPDPA